MNQERITPDNEKYMLIPREYLITEQPDDEISLIDIVHIFSQHKKVFYATFVIVLLVGIALALTLPQNYEYQSTIEIGRTGSGVIENPETAKSKIENSFIPTVQHQIAEKWGPEKVFEIKASIPKDANVVLLKSKGQQEDADIHKEAQQAVLSLLRKNHSPMFQNFRNQLLRKLELAQIDLQKLQDDSRFNTQVQSFRNRISAKQNKLKELQNKIELVDQKMAGLNRLRNIKLKDLEKANIQLAEFRKIQLNLFSDKSGDSSQKLLTQSMITGEIQRLTKRVSELEQYLQVTAEEQKKSLLNQKTAIIRSVEQQKRELQKLHSEFEDFQLSRKDRIQKKQIEIKSIQDKLQNLVETRFSSPVQQSIKPVGLGKGSIVVISTFLGIMLGMMFVFIAHFRQSLRKSDAR